MRLHKPPYQCEGEPERLVGAWRGGAREPGAEWAGHWLTGPAGGDDPSALGGSGQPAYVPGTWGQT